MDNELVYVLHTRKYRETSQLVDLLSRQSGRLRVVARGSQPGSKTKKGSTLTPLHAFQPFFANWRGKSDLKTLTSYESAGSVQRPEGDALYVGLYVNELLSRLLPEYIPLQDLFDQYAKLVTLLGHGVDPEPELRMFELNLLNELGYGVNLHADSDDGSPIIPDRNYRYLPGEGFSSIAIEAGLPMLDIFSGAHLLAIADHQFDNPAVRQSAKRLMRKALAAQLGDKPLYSRELYKQAVTAPGKVS
ncbi:MAG: DNA repair protein RecO [Cellvibrionales bacterium]|nr:MAG: DNA repair protein RecO [Cellvibrionales bacterium]